MFWSSMDYPDDSVYDCSLPQSSEHYKYKTLFIQIVNLFHRGRPGTLRFYLCCRLNYKNLVKLVEFFFLDRYNIFYVLFLEA
jgi:hypothetical protein